jgi:hypothetical protein
MRSFIIFIIQQMLSDIPIKEDETGGTHGRDEKSIQHFSWKTRRETSTQKTWVHGMRILK